LNLAFFFFLIRSIIKERKGEEKTLNIKTIEVQPRACVNQNMKTIIVLEEICSLVEDSNKIPKKQR
jgi:hypothetical protein